MFFSLKSTSSEETFNLGKKLALIIKAGDLISLTGDLGAGKTVFTKGIAKGLGVNTRIVSPTFTIIREYKGRLPFFHMDVYRIESADLDDLGYVDYFYSKAVTVVEWGEKIKNKLPADYLKIDFSYGEEKNDRILVFKGYGKWLKRIGKIKKLF